MNSLTLKCRNASTAMSWRYWRFACAVFVLILAAGCGGGTGSENPVAAGVGTASLAWEKPTTYEDGSPMIDLAGYQIYYSQTTPVTAANSQLVSVLNPNQTSYLVANLAPGTYYFTVTAVNLQGAESTMSNQAVKTIL
jgi:hypothetical protein